MTSAGQQRQRWILWSLISHAKVFLPVHPCGVIPVTNCWLCEAAQGCFHRVIMDCPLELAFKTSLYLQPQMQR